MPTKQDLDDAELSVLLTKAEPPKSPQHVDDYILAYARAQAVASEPGSRWRFLAVSKNWLNQNWFSAVATISVAVIAVSLSFQNFVPPSVDEIALATAAGRGVADFDVELDAPAGLRVQATQSLLAVNELSVEELPVEEEATLTLALKVDNANLAAAPGLVRSNLQAAASPVAATRPGLDTLLAADAAAQQSLIEMLTRVLIGPDQNGLATSAPLPDLIAPLISAYNQLADEPTIAAAADRYRDARLNFTAFDLPESLAQLMDFLQALEYPEPR